MVNTVRFPSSHLTWSHPPEKLELANDGIHVWRASLDLTTARIQNLRASLSPDEQARANRFRFDKPRKHFIAARGLLRAILSRYLHVPPNQLEFRYNPHGKPSLITSGKQPFLLNSQKLIRHFISRSKPFDNKKNAR